MYGSTVPLHHTHLDLIFSPQVLFWVLPATLSQQRSRSRKMLHRPWSPGGLLPPAQRLLPRGQRPRRDHLHLQVRDQCPLLDRKPSCTRWKTLCMFQISSCQRLLSQSLLLLLSFSLWTWEAGQQGRVSRWVSVACLHSGLLTHVHICSCRVGAVVLTAVQCVTGPETTALPVSCGVPHIYLNVPLSKYVFLLRLLEVFPLRNGFL